MRFSLKSFRATEIMSRYTCLWNFDMMKFLHDQEILRRPLSNMNEDAYYQVKLFLQFRSPKPMAWLKKRWGKRTIEVQLLSLKQDSAAPSGNTPQLTLVQGTEKTITAMTASPILFLMICRQFDREVLNGFFPHKEIRKYTCHQDMKKIEGL